MLSNMMQGAEPEIEQPVMLEHLVGSGLELPGMPEIYRRISEQLDDETCSVEQIGDSVQNDPAITTRVLKMANSSFYGLPSQVDSIAQAVALLGRERLKHLLIGSVLKGVFNEQDNPAFSIQAFWLDSIKTAIIARYIAGQVSMISEPESMFTAGLLHDIGKLVMINKFPARMLAVEEYMIQKRVDPLSAELSQIGVTHTAVGEALMEYWDLPQLLIDCTRNHHEVVHDGPNRYATHLIYLASSLSQYVPPLDDGETRDILDDIENWDMGYASLDLVAGACQHADDMVFEVMVSLGMVALEISSD